MKLLVFTDIHGSTLALKRITKKSTSADIIICCGDLTIFEQGLYGILKKLNTIGKRVLVIPGNHENTKRLKKVSSGLSYILFIDERFFETEKHLFFAIEGNGFSLDDKHFDKTIKKHEKKFKENKKKLILITHAPPYNTKLDKLFDGHCGNKSIRNFIIKYQPMFAFSGHIHDNFGKHDTLGTTKLLNPGPFGKIVNI